MSSKKRIKTLITILEESNINSMEVSSFWGFVKVKLSKSGRVDAVKTESSLPNIIAPQTNAPEIDEKPSNVNLKQPDDIQPPSDSLKENSNIEGYVQKAPLVGTVYLSPKPGEDNFVSEGEEVKKGQVICIIEAMKIFNEIEAEKDGIVKTIFSKNEDPVEFGQPLIEITSK
tara:strand:- start:805 stop:1320 length:516 start_codon:yes stop_codon:yes gene_type:complete